MAERFFVETPICGDQAALTGPEAHHLSHVMRARRGAQVVLFDGSGWEFTAAVQRIGRRNVDLRILRREEVSRELPQEILLGVALPKGDRRRWLVEKAVEIGVKRLVPLKTERAVVQPGKATLGRLRRTVIEASKQCGRNRLMEVAEPLDWPAFVEATHREPFRLLAHPDADGQQAESVPGSEPPRRAVLAVGPEGGFTPAEVARGVADGWCIVPLGPRVLRVETAALVFVIRTICTRT